MKQVVNLEEGESDISGPVQKVRRTKEEKHGVVKEQEEVKKDAN